MKNILIISSSFISNTYSYLIDYLLDEEDLTLQFLKENHCQDDLNTVQVRDYLLCDKIENCHNNTTFIVIDNDKIPETTLKYLQQRVNVTKEALYYLKLPQLSEYNCDGDKKRVSFEHIPTVLNISIGEISQQFCTEILLNKIFNKNEISFHQEFSQKSENLLCQMAKLGVLNEKIKKHLSENKFENRTVDIIIKSIEFTNLKDFIEKFDMLRKFKPDYLILNINQRFENLTEIRNYIRNKLGCNVFIMFSNYFEIQRTAVDKIYAFSTKATRDNSYPCISDKNIEENLSLEIFSNLCYPSGINIIN